MASLFFTILRYVGYLIKHPNYSGVQSGVWIAIGASALVMLIAFLGYQRINRKNSKSYP
ncbi:hypothetical protein JEP40_02035 [Proteus vulgaris]|uniref:hypothetical protein n=1 Tax=Proteus vulgaris TaxID=585 RepID=UPI0018E45BDC|nr:hypothetical protein [Proteus vulgaris]MBI6527908.1 hypothetical protein [Proteus vulgaris]